MARHFSNVAYDRKTKLFNKLLASAYGLIVLLVYCEIFKYKIPGY